MLNEHRFEAPVIHVVSESPRLEMLQTRLRHAGLRPVPVRGTYLPPDSAPALIDVLTRQNTLDGLENRLIVTIGKTNRTPALSHIHLTDVSQIESLPARLAIRQREIQRQREIELRARTAQRLGAQAESAAPLRLARLLWLGQDAPFLNAIKSGLGAGNVSLVAAISRLTAEDYLASGDFQSLVLCPAAANDEAARLLRSAKSLDVATLPRVILLLRPELAGQLASADIAQADEIIDLTTDLEQVAMRLHDVAIDAARALEAAAQPALIVGDHATGLAAREYLESHLQAQMEQADALALPLSVIAFSVANGEDMRALAQVITPLLRETDLAARLDSQHICLTLPNTNYRGAVVLARRIEESVSKPMDWRVIERRQFHTLKTLLGGLTARSPFSKQKSA